MKIKRVMSILAIATCALVLGTTALAAGQTTTHQKRTKTTKSLRIVTSRCPTGWKQASHNKRTGYLLCRYVGKRHLKRPNISCLAKTRFFYNSKKHIAGCLPVRS